MRLDELPKSQRVEDRRGMTAGRAGGMGIGTVVVLGLIGWAFGIDPRAAHWWRGNAVQRQPDTTTAGSCRSAL